MVEIHAIQQRGFHNTTDANGHIDGFEFKYVNNYYKGLWFTQCRFGNVVVDGEVFDRDDVTIVYDGMSYNREEMFDLKYYYRFRTPLIIRVKKPGGLSIGYHHVEYNFGWVLNYNATLEKEFDGSGLGNMDQMFGTHHERRMLLCR